MTSLCVFCSSSAAVDRAYFHAAEELGREMAGRGIRLVYGGTDSGLMGVLADTVLANGGEVLGVAPQALVERGIAYDAAKRAGRRPAQTAGETPALRFQLVITPDMATRKTEMLARADAFLALPGGVGTLDEVFEVLALKHLRYHSKPVVFLNVNGYWDGLGAFLEQTIGQKFSPPAFRDLYLFARDVKAAFEYLVGKAALAGSP